MKSLFLLLSLLLSIHNLKATSQIRDDINTHQNKHTLHVRGTAHFNPSPEEKAQGLRCITVNFNHEFKKGSLLSELSALKNIFAIDICKVDLSEETLENLCPQNKISQLTLSNCTLPDDFLKEVKNFKSLSVLKLTNTKLSYHIPQDILNISKSLKVLELPHNSLSGHLSDEITALTNLRTLNLSHNMLHSVPSGLSALTKLITLNLSYNRLSGELTEAFKNDNLEDLNLSHNLFSGKISSCIGGIDLDTLNLSYNRLSGNLPKTISKLTSLETLDVSSNNLKGTLPFCISKMKKLKLLKVKNNHLSGNLKSLNYKTLKSFDISYNDFASLQEGKILPLISLHSLDFQFANIYKNNPSSIIFYPQNKSASKSALSANSALKKRLGLSEVLNSEETAHSGKAPMMDLG